PFYYKGVSDDGLFRSFAEVIERVGEARLRVYLYHIPPVAQVPITLGLVERLLKAYPTQIAGMKDSGGEGTNTKAFLDAFAKSGFDVFAGSETFLLQNMRSGGAGCISATANVHPGPIARLFDMWRAADADAQQARLDVIRGGFQKFPMIPALKSAIAHHRGDPGGAAGRPPLRALPGAPAGGLGSGGGTGLRARAAALHDAGSGRALECHDAPRAHRRRSRRSAASRGRPRLGSRQRRSLRRHVPGGRARPSQRSRRVDAGPCVG